MERVTAHVIIDYQNIHLTAHGCFKPKGMPAHLSLVHPLHFANQVLQARQARLSELAIERGDRPPEELRLAKVSVFRGLPSNKHHPDGYRRNLAQQSEWTRDRRVEVVHRALRYYSEHGSMVPREKGVDVLIALELVRSADGGEHGVIILASHDTDLEPALDAALESGKARIETTGWKNQKRLKPTGSRRLWHTFLAAEHFERSCDRRDYT